MLRPELIVNGLNFKDERFKVGADGLRLGRSSNNDISIPDEELSRNHCIFESVGDSGLRIADIASSNGTLVNGKNIGSESVLLSVGDVVEAGSVKIMVVEAQPAKSNIDLGLDNKEIFAPVAPKAANLKLPIRYFIYALVAIIILVAIAMLISTPKDDGDSSAAASPIADNVNNLITLQYEKVNADTTAIFRYALSLTPNGVLSVAIDDVPIANRKLRKSVTLNDSSRKLLEEIIVDSELTKLSREYLGDENSQKLFSRTLKVECTDYVREVRLQNAMEPSELTELCERLEEFARNQLGVWATAYSREQLEALAHESTLEGDLKWNDRDVEYGNLYAAVKAYRSAVLYLESLSPKPNNFEALQNKLSASEQELDARICNRNFLVDRALGIKDYETARMELLALCAIIPDRSNDNNRAATKKLIEVEAKLRKRGAQ